MRCFVALPLPDPLIGSLERLLARIPVGRPVPEENLHLTLAFLDEQPQHVLEAVHEELGQLSLPAFPLQVAGLGSFGTRTPKLLWAGLRDSTAVSQLQAKVLGALHRAGLELPHRRFRPHITLAWLDKMAPDEEARLAGFLSRNESFPAPEVQIEDFALYQSILTKASPVYEILASYPLGKGPRPGDIGSDYLPQ